MKMITKKIALALVCIGAFSSVKISASEEPTMEQALEAFKVIEDFKMEWSTTFSYAANILQVVSACFFVASGRSENVALKILLSAIGVGANWLSLTSAEGSPMALIVHPKSYVIDKLPDTPFEYDYTNGCVLTEPHADFADRLSDARTYQWFSLGMQTLSSLGFYMFGHESKKIDMKVQYPGTALASLYNYINGPVVLKKPRTDFDYRLTAANTSSMQTASSSASYMPGYGSKKIERKTTYPYAALVGALVGSYAGYYALRYAWLAMVTTYRVIPGNPETITYVFT